MTENKRFTVTQDFEEHHRQIRDNGHIIMGCFIEPQAEVIVNLLNELNDENDVLKQQLKTKYIVNKQYEELQKVKEENEELKSENQHIKNLITEAYANERTALGKSVLKQLMEAIQ